VTQAVSAGWVLPVDGAPIRDAYVAWDDEGRIVEVAPGRVERHYPEAIVLPGIVNAHSHIEYAVYAGFGDGLDFGGWLATHITRKRRLDREATIAIARRGAADSLAAGITTTADYSFSGASGIAAAELGLRAVVYLEVFGGDVGREAERFGELASTLPQSDLLTVGVSPHAPYTCTTELYAWCLSLGIPVGTHLAEMDGENEWLLDGTGPLAASRDVLVEPTGKRSVASLEPVLGPELLCAHCVTVDEDEIELLAGRDVPVVHCPRSNAFLGCGVAPLAAMRAAGVRVGIGTDSPASTPSLDPWDEVRAAVAGARARERRPDALDAEAALRLATLDAARALGLDSELGSLTPGKLADITVVSTTGSPYDPVEDPTVAVVFGGSPSGVLETLVGGQTRYRQGETAWPEVRSIASAARRRMLG
jgi:cytosine/adenosine deaminase-related metal-dependent hydrolase